MPSLYSNSFRLTLRAPGKSTDARYGTAWISTTGHVVTAFHCVSFDKRDWWLHTEPYWQCLLHLSSGETCLLKPCESDPEADLATLTFYRDADRVKLLPHALELNVAFDGSDQFEWSAPCYPKARAHEYFSLYGTATAGNPTDAKVHWQLHASQHANRDSSGARWKGASGAPVIERKGNQVIGVLLSDHDEVDALYATSATAVQRLLERPPPISTGSIADWLCKHGKIGILIDDRQPEKSPRRLARSLYGVPVLPRWWYKHSSSDPVLTCAEAAVPVLEALDAALAQNPDYQAIIVIDRYLPIIKDGQPLPWDGDDDLDDQGQAKLRLALQDALIKLHDRPKQCFFRYVTSHPELSFRQPKDGPRRPDGYLRWKTRSLEAMRTLRDEIRTVHRESGNKAECPLLLRLHSEPRIHDALLELSKRFKRQKPNPATWALWTGIHAYTDHAYPQMGASSITAIYEIEERMNKFLEPPPPEDTPQDQIPEWRNNVTVARDNFAAWKQESRSYWLAREERVSVVPALLMKIDWSYVINTTSASDIMQTIPSGPSAPLRAWMLESGRRVDSDRFYFGPVDHFSGKKYSSDLGNLRETFIGHYDTFLNQLADEIDSSPDRPWAIFIVGEEPSSFWVQQLAERPALEGAVEIYWVSEARPPELSPTAKGKPKACKWLNMAPLEFAHDLWHYLQATSNLSSVK